MRIFLVLLFVGFASMARAQVNFPDAYLGTWKGVLRMEPAGAEVPMTLRLGPAISKDSVYEYVLTYHGKTEDVRRYELHVTDKRRGFFSVDEKNSIVLNERLIGNKLISIFTVEGSALLITLELKENEIVFEVVSWPANDPKTSGAKTTYPRYTTTGPMLTKGPCSKETKTGVWIVRTRTRPRYPPIYAGPGIPARGTFWQTFRVSGVHPW